MTDAEFATYLSAWEVARDARNQDPTSANMARAASAREAYLAALDIQRGDARELTVVDWAPGVPQDVRDRRPLPDMSAPGAWVHFAMSAPPPEPRDGAFGDLLKRLGLLDWSGPGPRVRVQIAPPVVRPLYRVDWGDDIQADIDATNARKRGDQVDDEDPEGPNPDDMVPGPDVPDWFFR